MSVCNRVQVTKNDQHFIRLMSMMEERKNSTQTTNYIQGYSGDWHAPGPPPYWQKPPTKKKSLEHKQGEEAFASEQSALTPAGESIASGLCARLCCFSPGRPQYRSRGQRCRIKNSLQVLGKSLGEKKCMCGCLICACKCFIARESLNARAWFMAVFYAHTGAFLALVTPTLCPPNK